MGVRYDSLDVSKALLAEADTDFSEANAPDGRALEASQA